MALEVNEIGIRLRVGEDGGEPGEGRRCEKIEQAAGGLDRGEIVDDCVRRVLQILKGRRER